MPTYFFHLKLELYPSANTNPASAAEASRHGIFLPSQVTDIFKTQLPAHRTGKWASQPVQGGHTRDRSSTSGVESATSTPRSRPQSAGIQETHGDALLLPERNIALKKEALPSSPVIISARGSSEAAARDWRFGPVSIESIDMEATSKTKEKGASNGSSGLHTKGIYLPSDPKTTDVGWGVVHLYRDTQETPELDPDSYYIGKDTEARQRDGSFDLDQCTTLCILAVPSWMMPSDLLGFVGEETREHVSHFRLIRTGRANKYMVLMKFRQAKKAREWQKAWNGKLFSAMEPENCHVVFIKSIEFLTPSNSSVSDPSAFPQNTNDPFTLSATQRRSPPPSNKLSAKPHAPPTPSLIELPTCPVCLERMDETTGLLTILCQHVFHCACLEKWRGSGCPVCRYTQSPSFTFPYPRPSNYTDDDEDAEPACSICASTTNLWICLICGNTGCGRYDSAHAFAHYESTSHCYAMDISTQHVWDYAGDGYVHRLIQNKPDSKLIDLPSGARDQSRHPNSAFRAEEADLVPREKMEGMATEYTFLLTSQLEGQRRYYEEQLERAVDKASQANRKAEDAVAAVAAASAQIAHLQVLNQEQMAALSRLEKAHEKGATRADKFEKMAREMSTQLREEKTMNEGLLKRIHAAEQVAKEREQESEKLKAEKLELEDMNRDLTIFISSQDKVRELQAAGEEVEMGTVSVPEAPAQAPTGKRKGKGKKKA